MSTPTLATIRTVMHETALNAMPELAPQIEHDPTVIQRHLIRELGMAPTRRVLELINGWSYEDPEVSPIESLVPTESEIKDAQALVKYERYSLVQSGTRRQADLLLAGRPDNPTHAQFMPDRLAYDKDHSEDGYWNSQAALFNTAAEEAMDLHPWLDSVDMRYQMLYRPFSEMRPYNPNSIIELSSMVLPEAMNGAGLRAYTVESSELIGKHPVTKRFPHEKKMQVAHDIAYLGLIVASQHFEVVGNINLASIAGDVQQLSTDKWIYVRDKDDFIYKRLTDRTERYSPILKCPVHQPSREEPTSDLEYYIHASINAAEGYDLFQ